MYDDTIFFKIQIIPDCDWLGHFTKPIIQSVGIAYQYGFLFILLQMAIRVVSNIYIKPL
jgi:hypothetical protein